jgi:hypothetical protein
MDDLPPTAKRQKTTTTTTAAEDENETANLDEEKREAATTAKDDDDRTFLDLLRSLPANIVANYIYPFAVKVIQNREELITAVDEYLDEFYSGDDAGEEDDDDDDDVGNDQRIRYPIGDWDVSGVDDFTCVFSCMRNRKAHNSTKICHDGTWRMGPALPECFMVAVSSIATFPTGVPAARPT